MRILFTLITIIFITSCSLSTPHKEVEVPQHYKFLPSATVEQDINSKLTLAKKENKKLLLVLGGQWCHDSRGLAAKFTDDKMQSILADNYQSLFIDVGYLDKGFDVVNRFGLPVYYGTPTVMIIDANTEQLINEDSMRKWLSADSIEIDQYHQYFAEMANKKQLAEKNIPARLEAYYQQIEQIELTQAARIKKAYQELGPVLANFKENGVQFPEEAVTAWQQVHKLRYNLQKDLLNLKKQAKEAVAHNKPLTIHLPDYGKFYWE
jgi:hypothetical protein